MTPDPRLEQIRATQAKAGNTPETEVAYLLALIDTLQRERDELRYALVKVRGHTSYIDPTLELLEGLLKSVERIADAALSTSSSEQK